MAQKKIISIRLDTTDLVVIDEIVKNRSYLNRSRVIGCLVSAMLYCCKDMGLFEVLDCYDPVSDGIVMQVTKKEKLFKSSI